LAAHGALVVGAARDLKKAHAATEQVRAQAANGGGLGLVALDLAPLASVRDCHDIYGVTHQAQGGKAAAAVGIGRCAEARAIIRR
jgi:hypothetical protein